MHQDTIFADQGNQIGEGGERDDVQVILQIDGGIRPSLKQRVSDFKGFSGAAKIRKFSVRLRIDQGHAIGSIAGDFVMIEDDDVSSALTNHRHFAR